MGSGRDRDSGFPTSSQVMTLWLPHRLHLELQGSETLLGPREPSFSPWFVMKVKDIFSDRAQDGRPISLQLARGMPVLPTLPSYFLASATE